VLAWRDSDSAVAFLYLPQIISRRTRSFVRRMGSSWPACACGCPGTDVVRVTCQREFGGIQRQPGSGGRQTGSHRFEQHSLRTAARPNRLQPSLANPVVNGPPRDPEQAGRVIEGDTASQPRLTQVDLSKWGVHVRLRRSGRARPVPRRRWECVSALSLYSRASYPSKRTVPAVPRPG
jgi:hypothetical protein